MTNRKIVNTAGNAVSGVASEGTDVRHLPDELTVTIDGVIYRVHSIFGEKTGWMSCSTWPQWRIFRDVRENYCFKA